MPWTSPRRPRSCRKEPNSARSRECPGCPLTMASLFSNKRAGCSAPLQTGMARSLARLHQHLSLVAHHPRRRAHCPADQRILGPLWPGIHRVWAPDPALDPAGVACRQRLFRSPSGGTGSGSSFASDRVSRRWRRRNTLSMGPTSHPAAAARRSLPGPAGCCPCSPCARQGGGPARSECPRMPGWW